jgi:hypothetical protein
MVISNSPVKDGTRPKTRRPSPETYRAAIRILAETMRPWRPAELFKAAFTPTADHPGPVGREGERFREHFAGLEGVIKRGPWYALERWFSPVLPVVTPQDFVAIGLDGRCIRAAQGEALRRLPYMKVRNPAADHIARAMAAIDGHVVEHHVREFFRARWPGSYRPKTNARRFDRPAADDFSLLVCGRWYAVDVARSNEFYPPDWELHRDKMRGAGIRLIAFFDRSCVTIQGYLKGEGDLLYPIERLIVRLNTGQMGIQGLFPSP